MLADSTTAAVIHHAFVFIFRINVRKLSLASVWQALLLFLTFCSRCRDGSKIWMTLFVSNDLMLCYDYKK